MSTSADRSPNTRIGVIVVAHQLPMLRCGIFAFEGAEEVPEEVEEEVEQTGGLTICCLRARGLRDRRPWPPKPKAVGQKVP